MAIHDFFDRLSKTETYATADMKGKIDRTPKKVSSRKKTRDSFFDRMAKTDTFASADMKGKINRMTNVTSSKSGPKTTSAFFDRMSKAETYASLDMKRFSSRNFVESEESSISSRSRCSARTTTVLQLLQYY